MVFQQFEDADHYVIDIAEPGRLILFRVMQAPTPVDANIALIVVQFLCALEARAGVHRAELEKTVENRTVIPEIELLVILKRNSPWKSLL